MVCFPNAHRGWVLARHPAPIGFMDFTTQVPAQGRATARLSPLPGGWMWPSGGKLYGCVCGEVCQALPLRLALVEAAPWPGVCCSFKSGCGSRVK